MSLVLALILIASSIEAAAALDRRQGPPEQQHPAPSFDAYREFGSRDGLAQSTAYALAQDRAGYVWVGTEDGVSRYDGHRWRRVPVPGDSPAPPFVNALTATDDGAVWVATDESGLLRWDGTQLRAYGAERGLDLASIQGVSNAGNDAVWVATVRGVARCDTVGCRWLEATRAINAWCSLAALADDGTPVLWLGTSGSGLFRISDPGGAATLDPLHIGVADGLPADTVRSLAVFGGPRSRDLWIGTGFGISRLSGDTLTVYGESIAVTNSQTSGFAVSVNEQGLPILLATLQRGGLLEFHDDGSWRRYTLRHGLPDDGLYSLLLTDRERQVPRLWLGTQSSGVARRENGRWHTIDTRQGLPHRAIRGVGYDRFPDGVEAYWISTVNGSVRLVDDHWVALGPAPIDRASIYQIARQADGVMWLATDLGLIRWSVDGIRVLDRRVLGTNSNTVIAAHIHRGADGREELWLGTRIGYVRLIDGQVAPPPSRPEHLGPTVRVFAETTDAHGVNTLWAGGEGGLSGWRNGAWIDLDLRCLPHPEVMDVRVRDDGGVPVLWIATRGGITRVRLDPDMSCAALTTPKLSSPTVYQLQFDARGRIYLFGYDGVLRLTPDPAAPDDLQRMGLERYDESDGLPALEFNRASMVDSVGRLWAGGVAGVVVFDPARDSPPQSAKPLVLEHATVLGTQRPLRPDERLAADAGNVDFGYSLLSYEREHLTRYRTELVGLDSAPGPWTSEAQVSYLRLPPGAYAFKVWGRDALGNVSGPREIAFGVDQPYWQRPWAIAAYALVLLLLGVGIGRLRDRALAARAAQLEREVGERTSALGEANRQLERASLTDPLTGLSNRRFFGAHLATELERLADRVARGQPPIPRLLCLIDLDYFKAINDRFGHAAGDTVLAGVAQALGEHCSQGGVALRWGGEEFLVVVDVPEGRDPAALAAALVNTVRNRQHVVGGREVSVTCSVGWALWPWHPQTPRLVNLDQALTLADQALYRAKGGGRNRAVGALCDEHAPPLAEHPELRVRWRL